MKDGFGRIVNFAINLACTIHVRRNVAELRDIFGRRQGDVLIEGLINSVDEADFDHRLLLLEKKWSARERSEPHTDIFSPWLRKYKYSQIKYSMIRSVRQAAGMGHLPEHFTTNASESINSVLKLKVDYKRSELLIFVTRLNELVNEQTEEIEKAVINQGKYQLKKEYGYLHIQQSKWFKMSHVAMAEVNGCLEAVLARFKTTKYHQASVGRHA